MIGDGLATDIPSAQAYIASKSSAQIATYVRSKSADTVLTTVLTKLAPLGASGSGPIPDGNVVPTSAIAAIQAGQYLKVPDPRGQHARRGQALPDSVPARRRHRQRPPAQRRDGLLDRLQLQPERGAADDARTVDPAAVLPITTPVTGFNAVADKLNNIFFLVSRDSVLNAAKTQQGNIWYYRFDWDELPVPFNDIYGAAHAFDLAFAFGNFGPALYSNISYTTANQPGRLALSDAMMRSIGAFARNGDPNNPSLGVTWPVWPATLRVRCDGDGQGDLRPIGAGSGCERPLAAA